MKRLGRVFASGAGLLLGLALADASVIKNSKKADAANFGAPLIRFGRRVIGGAWMGAEIADVTLTV